jgi:hypothetical protein
VGRPRPSRHRAGGRRHHDASGSATRPSASVTGTRSSRIPWWHQPWSTTAPQRNRHQHQGIQLPHAPLRRCAAGQGRECYGRVTLSCALFVLNSVHLSRSPTVGCEQPSPRRCWRWAHPPRREARSERAASSVGGAHGCATKWSRHRRVGDEQRRSRMIDPASPILAPQFIRSLFADRCTSRPLKIAIRPISSWLRSSCPP